MRAHTQYSGGYSASSDTVRLFWKVAPSIKHRLCPCVQVPCLSREVLQACDLNQPSHPAAVYLLTEIPTHTLSLHTCGSP